MNDKERFNTFTERARKVLSLAQEEAQRFNHNYVGTEHLLLGLVREGDGIAADVLGSLGVNLEKVRAQTIQVLNQSGGSHTPQGSSGRLRLTLSAERVAEMQAEMQNTFQVGVRNPTESLVEAQERAYALARSMSELLAEIARLQDRPTTYAKVRMQDEWLTTRDVAKKLGVSEQTVADYRNDPAPNRRLKAYRIASLVYRYKRSDVEDFLIRHTTDPNKDTC